MGSLLLFILYPIITLKLHFWHYFHYFVSYKNLLCGMCIYYATHQLPFYQMPVTFIKGKSLGLCCLL